MMTNAVDYHDRSPSYRRGFVAGQQGDVEFARLIEGASDREEAMKGYADGARSIDKQEAVTDAIH